MAFPRCAYRLLGPVTARRRLEMHGRAGVIRRMTIINPVDVSRYRGTPAEFLVNQDMGEPIRPSGYSPQVPPLYLAEGVWNSYI